MQLKIFSRLFFPRLRFYVAKLWSCVFSNEALTSLDRSDFFTAVSRNPSWFGSVSDVVPGSPQWPVQSSFFGKAHKVPAGAEGHVLGAAMKLTPEKKSNSSLDTETLPFCSERSQIPPSSQLQIWTINVSLSAEAITSHLDNSLPKNSLLTWMQKQFQNRQSCEAGSQ